MDRYSRIDASRSSLVSSSAIRASFSARAASIRESFSARASLRCSCVGRFSSSWESLFIFDLKTGVRAQHAMQAPKSAAASIPPMKDIVLVLHCSMIHSLTNIAEAIDAINIPPRANAMRRAVFSTLSRRALVLSLFIYAPIAVCIPECSAPSFSSKFSHSL